MELTSGGREVAGSSPVIPTEAEKRAISVARFSRFMSRQGRRETPNAAVIAWQDQAFVCPKEIPAVGWLRGLYFDDKDLTGIIIRTMYREFPSARSSIRRRDRQRSSLEPCPSSGTG